MNLRLLDSVIQQFIQHNLDADITRLALKPSPFPQVSSRELAEQIAGKKAIEKKLPTWFSTSCIIYPPKISLEQCSSEATAEYKSRLIKGNKVLDLSGGYGVDTLFFAKKAEKVTHIEPQENLSEIARHNAALLGANHIKFEINYAEMFLETNQEKWDTIYLDPSRRDGSQKVFKLADCHPNIVTLQDRLFELSPYILLKTAPLLDIRSGLSELKNVGEIHVLSLNNEVRELVWLLDRNYTGAEPVIHCISLGKTEQQYSFTLAEEKAFELRDYANISEYVYEPDTAWLKAGCFKLISRDYEVGKIHQHTHLYTANHLINDFPGRKFKVIHNLAYKTFAEKKFSRQANLITRNFPLTAPQLQKKHHIKDGGSTYLIACTDLHGELRILEAERI
jgi:hypothetical protein